MIWTFHLYLLPRKAGMLADQTSDCLKVSHASLFEREIEYIC